MSKPKTITIDDVEYVRKDSVSESSVDLEGMPYVIIRSRDSGCHAGYLKYSNGNGTVELVQSRRLWAWSGANCLSQMANEGVKNPLKCKFSGCVDLEIYGACEKLDTTRAAQDSIQGVPVWKA